MVQFELMVLSEKLSEGDLQVSVRANGVGPPPFTSAGPHVAHASRFRFIFARPRLLLTRPTVRVADMPRCRRAVVPWARSLAR